jgi:hypothetical protein
MMNVLLFPTAGVKLSGEGATKDENFEITTLRLIKTDAIQAAFVLDSVIKIPLALLKWDAESPPPARVDLSGSESRKRVGKCARRIRFSAARYSF